MHIHHWQRKLHIWIALGDKNKKFQDTHIQIKISKLLEKVQITKHGTKHT